MPLSIGVLKETFAHEARVALTPDVAAKFLELGVPRSHMERGAGERSHLGDELYQGVQFHADRRRRARRTSTVLLKVQPPTPAEVDALAPGLRGRRLHASRTRARPRAPPARPQASRASPSS